MKQTGVFFGGSFLLHLLWENLQAPLYVGYTSFRQHFWICFRATFGDLFVMLLIYGVLALIHRNMLWPSERTSYAKVVTWGMPVAMGGIFAVGYERWAVYDVHRWAYDAMPMLPFLNVGLTPVLQMLIIPAIVVMLCARTLPAEQ